MTTDWRKPRHLKVEFIVGIDRDKDGAFLTPPEVSFGLEGIERVLLAHFPGYTRVGTKGGWINPKKQIVEETGRAYSVIIDTEDPGFSEAHFHGSVTVVAQFMALALNQDCVAVSISPVYFSLINQ